MSDPDDLISVYQAADPIEGQFVKNILENEGILAQVSEVNDPFVALSFAAPDVLVKLRDEVRAREIVGQYEREQEERGARPDWTCPSCGATVIGGFDECDACGADRKGTS